MFCSGGKKDESIIHVCFLVKLGMKTIPRLSKLLQLMSPSVYMVAN